MAPRNNTLLVSGYKEFAKAMTLAPKDVRREVREAFRAVGENVRDDADRNFSSYGSTAASVRSHAASAAGYRVVVRQRGVEVDSRRRKTTGLHSEYGAAQMRHGLLPAAKANEGRAARRMERAMVEVAAIFERRSK